MNPGVGCRVRRQRGPAAVRSVEAYVRAYPTARLERVRRILSVPPPDGLTVTEVATRRGFFELGRFASAYRHVYGESPSATLREARQRSGA